MQYLLGMLAVKHPSNLSANAQSAFKSVARSPRVGRRGGEGKGKEGT